MGSMERSRRWQLFSFALMSGILLIAFNNCSRLEFSKDAYSDSTASPAGISKVELNSTLAEGEDWVPGRILVQPRAGLAESEFEAILRPMGAREIDRIKALNIRILQLPPQASEKAVAALLSKNPKLKFAELDRKFQPSFADDPYASSAWHLPKIRAPEAWSMSTGSRVVVAILDSGVDDTHPDLVGKLVPGWNMFNGNSDTRDVYGHGTKVAGAVGAATNNGIGVASIAGDALLMPMRIAGTDGYGSTSAIANGLVWAADHGARVANISFYGVESSSSCRSAAQYFKNKGGLVTTSAGNYGKEETISPSDTMITASATTSGDALTSWSSYGNFVEISGPGAGIYTTTRGGGYGAVSGTSFSSPVVGAVVALMMAANPNLSPGAIEKLLYSTAIDLGTSGWDKYYGHGRVDAAAAVAAAKGTSSTDTTLPTVAITSPSQGAQVKGLITVDVAANDNIGVVRVDLIVDGKLFASDSSAPYGFALDTTQLADGSRGLVAQAHDAAGNKASHSISITVANTVVDPTPTPTPTPTPDAIAPTVQISQPVAGARLSGANLKIIASASDNIAVTTMKVYIDGQLKASVKGSVLNYNWNHKKVSTGTHVIEVRAQDAAGNIGVQSVSVTK